MITGFGVGLPHQNYDPSSGKPLAEISYAQTLELLGRPPIWHNWRFDLPTPTGLLDPATPTLAGWIRTKFDPLLDDAANRAAILSRSSVGPWILGNEPGRDPKLGGSQATPAQAAEFSRFWADMAEGPYALPGILLGLSESYDWLAAFLQAKGEIGPYIHAHLYAWTAHHFNETLSHFSQLLAQLKIPRPIILTEIGSWDPSLPTCQSIMEAAWLALEYHNIMAGFWYASHDPFGSLAHNDLIAGSHLSPLGQFFRQLQSRPPLHTIYLPVISRAT